MRGARLATLGVLVATFAGCGEDGPATVTDAAASADTQVAMADAAGADGSEPDANVPDAPVVDMFQRDLPPFERSMPPPPPVGHGWNVVDIGDVGGNNGALSVTPNLFTVRGGGLDIGGAADSFAFAYQNVTGDTDFVARVRSVQMKDPRTTAGVMIRAAGTSSTGAMAFLGLLGDAAKGGQVVWRAKQGAAAELRADDPSLRPGQFLRIRREGKRVTLLRSIDRTGWAKVASLEVDLPEEVAIGIAVSARAAAVAAAEVDFSRLWSGDGLARGWDLEPLSGIGASGAMRGDQVTLTAIGDPHITTAEFGAGVWRAMSGSEALTANVEGIGPEAPGGRLALVMREGGPGRISPAARHVLVSVTAAGAVQFQARDRTPNFQAGKVAMGLAPPLWLRLVRVDDPSTEKTRITGFYSKDGSAWTELDSVEIPLADPIVGGALLTSGDPRLFATARISAFHAGSAPTPVDAGAEPPPPDAGSDL